MDKKILTIQDYSSIGRCSLTAALPILAACGHDAVGLPTALLSTQTYGIEGYTFTDLCHNMLPSYNHWKSLGIKFDCFYSGFLGSIDIANATMEIAKDLKKQGTLIAVDPAMAESGKMYAIFDDEYKQKMIELCKLADIVMPNFTEGKILADINVDLVSNMQNAEIILNILKHNGYKNVLLSGISNEVSQGVALLHNGKITYAFNTQFNAFIHGAGDCLSSVFIGKLMNGYSYENASQAAVNFCRDCIDVSLKAKCDLRFGLLIEQIIPNMKEY